MIGCIGSRVTKTKLRGLSPRANYTERAAAACWRSWCQLLRVEGCHTVLILLIAC
jgi:hypothetical protein